MVSSAFAWGAARAGQEAAVKQIQSDLDPDLVFESSDGEPLSLEAALDGRPAVLALGYLECPQLCSWSLDAVGQAVMEAQAEAGADFTVLFLSLDPAEELGKMRSEEARLSKRYGSQDGGWRLLRGSEGSLASVTDSLGYVYAETEDGGYAHPVAYFVVDGGGAVTRGFYGLELPKQEFASALSAAQRGERLSWADAFLMECAKLLPADSVVEKWVRRALRGGSLLTLAALGGGIVWLSCRGREEESGR